MRQKGDFLDKLPKNSADFFVCGVDTFLLFILTNESKAKKYNLSKKPWKILQISRDKSV